ncbi:Gfo/Idh/MocA family protein [Shewanella sp. SR43-8]|uniref:Gfo/Idh/MocA family protein n=1 Tax=Shewanella sp. SR43-8 TaxID=2760938 RepID=UPI001601AA63|nr:Gfo/Idh/MocA family oxidoreductase [Shewanella sp. SR43-8]MBB1320171.1 Gfo/Idh/MocA family oxidoreductase [Shewanella sp. SR43-8]
MLQVNLNRTPLKIGFIGGSHGSAVGYAHSVACQLDGFWTLTSGCFSRDIEKSHETGKFWGIEVSSIYSDWQLYIKEQGKMLDAVVVLTPTPSHEEIVCQLLYAGIAVICEKAMAASVSQSLSIQQALKETNGFLAVTFNYSGYPMLRVLKRHVEAGDLGNVLQVRVEMPSDGFIQDISSMAPQAWRLVDGDIPTLLLDLAVHVHHISDFVTGCKPLSVNADFNHFSVFEGIVDDANIWLKCEQGIRASYWVSKTAIGYKNGLKISVFGDKGSGHWVQEEPELLHLFNQQSVETTYNRGNCRFADEIRERFKPGHPGGFIEAFANLYQDIGHALIEYKQTGSHQSPYVFGWQHAHDGLVLLDAATRSHQQQQWIDLT